MTLRKKVVALIFDENAKILLGKYSPDYKHWSKLGKSNNRALPGGGKDEWENFREALYREIYEEVGIVEKDLEFVFVYNHPYYKKYPAKTKKRFGEYRESYIHGKKQKFYILHFIGDKNSISQNITDEFCELAWVPINKLPNYIDQKILDFLKLDDLHNKISSYLKNKKSG